MDRMTASFKLKTFENVGYNSIGKAIIMAFQVAANIVLARNLASSDYGIAGFAMMVTRFLTQFGEMGIQTAVVQADGLDEKGLYTGFTLKAALGLAVFAAALILSPLAGSLSHNESVGKVVRLLSLNFAINSFAFLPGVALLRDLDYRKLFVPQVASSVVNSILSILLARAGYGYWSIILANVISTVVSVALINAVRPIKIRFLYDREWAAGFIRFGKDLLVSGLIVFAILNVDNFAIGVFKGTAALGYYSVAFNWGSMICGMLGTVVLSVLFPTFSRFKGDRQRIKKAYLRALEYVSFAGILVNVGLFMVSKELLFLVLGRGGEKWLPALASLRILCFYGIIRLLLEPAGSVLMALGRTGTLLAAQAAMAGVELVLLYPVLNYFGINGVATAITAAYLLNYAVLFPRLKGDLGLSMAEWAAPVLPAAFSAIAAAGVLSAAGRWLPFSIYGMVGKIAIFSGTYFAAYGTVTKWKMLREIRDTVAEFRLKDGDVPNG